MLNAPPAIELSNLVTLLPPELVLSVTGVLTAVAVLTFPVIRRGPNSGTYRDPWRTFRYAARDEVMARAGGRCEAPMLLAWGRCGEASAEADHIIPWSKGGPTTLTNGQALCVGHNRSKGALFPAWWYVIGLERRRRAYFPAGAEVRVRAALSTAESDARDAWLARRSRQR